MRKVKNRKAIRRVADRTRKAAKSRNLIAVLAIALTALLLPRSLPSAEVLWRSSRRPPCARWEEAPTADSNT